MTLCIENPSKDPAKKKKKKKLLELISEFSKVAGYKLIYRNICCILYIINLTIRKRN